MKPKSKLKKCITVTLWFTLTVKSNGITLKHRKLFPSFRYNLLQDFTHKKYNARVSLQYVPWYHLVSILDLLKWRYIKKIKAAITYPSA